MWMGARSNAQTARILETSRTKFASPTTAGRVGGARYRYRVVEWEGE
jgi:hypothetical protein